jgi:glycosyltransferase involved in cell wall biosynthesis
MSISEVDLLHVMHEQVPVTKSKNILMTVHDMGPLLYPELFTKKFRSAWKKSLDKGLELADKIIGVSKTVENQLREYRPEFSDKYHGILLGVSEEFLNNYDPEPDKEFIISKGINFPYILYIGAADPKKNLLTFIEAYSLFLKETKPAPPHHVVLVGNTAWGGYGQFKHKTRDLGIDNRIHFTGYIEHQYLPALYRESELFVFPSLFEGFGLPVLEAMASGAPCLISNRPALDEVGGNIAEYFDPEFPEDMANKMQLLLENPGRLAEMRIEGREYAHKFSWERTAKETIRIYEEVLGSTLV